MRNDNLALVKNQSTAFITGKPISKPGHYYSLMLLLFLFCPVISAQTMDNWEEIFLFDTIKYTLYGTEHIPDQHYPPSQLFDDDYATCWVSRVLNDSIYPSVFIALPKDLTNNMSLSIFSGYGKSESLFLKNARPGKVQVSFYTALVPDGYVTEYGLLCKALQSPYHETIFLADTFGVQEIPLQNSYEKFKPYHQKVLLRYKSNIDFSLLDTIPLLKIEILSVYPGTTYDDICISEIFFGKR